MTSNRRIKEIASMVENKYSGEYDFIGIRVQEQRTNEIGDYMTHKSSIWIEGEETEELLDGVSAVDVREAAHLEDVDYGGYMGNVVYILGCDYATYGEDEGEIVMEDAIVLEIIG